MSVADRVLRATYGAAARLRTWPVGVCALLAGVLSVGAFELLLLLVFRPHAKWTNDLLVAVCSGAAILLISRMQQRPARTSLWTYLIVLIPVAAAFDQGPWWLLAVVPAVFFPAALLALSDEDVPSDAHRAPPKRRTSVS